MRLDFDARLLRDALVTTTHGAAKEEDRPVLTQHHFRAAGDGVDVITADNYRIVRFHIPMAVPKGMAPFSIWPDDVAVIVKWLGKRTDVTLAIETGGATLTDGDDRLHFRLAEGKLPDWDSVIAKPTVVPVALAARLLGEAGKAIAGSKFADPAVRVYIPNVSGQPVLIETVHVSEWIMPVRQPGTTNAE